MDRRTFLLTVGTVGVGVGVGGAGVAAAASDPHRPAPVFGWELTGGFLPPAYAAIRPPRLAVYADGVLVADAERRLRLSHADVQALRTHATTVLSNPANARRRPGAPIIADVPFDVLSVLSGAGHRLHEQFEGLQETRADRAYPPAVYPLLDHITGLHDRALKVGVPFHPDAVRLLAVVVDPQSGHDTPWPAGVPVPYFAKDAIVGRADLRGAAARAAIHAIPHSTEQWAQFRTRDGRLLSTGWRYLLPHE